MSALIKKYIGVASLLVGVVVYSATTCAAQGLYDRIVVFGASYSDSGNAFALLSDPQTHGFDEDCLITTQSVPPYDALDDLVIPESAYARGGHHFTNGATWVELLARRQGLSGSTRPALANENDHATNYAVGGARVLDYPCRFNLSAQLATYLADHGQASATTLFIFDIGGNDLRDVIAQETDPSEIPLVLGNIAGAIQALYLQGARNFLLVNVGGLGSIPSMRALDRIFPGIAQAADQLALGFNLGLAQVRDLANGLPDADVRILDMYGLLATILAAPESYGLTDVSNPCVSPDVPPYVCKKPDTYLFWDGVHVTRAVHRIIAMEAEKVLGEGP